VREVDTMNSDRKGFAYGLAVVLFILGLVGSVA
jgi:hypothetical protein